MKLDELTEMMKLDSVIDESNLDGESLKISYLHGKWYSLYVSEARVLRTVHNELKALRRTKTEYYLGKATDEVYLANPLHLKVLRSDLDTYLDSDPDLIMLDERVNTQKLKCEMLESFIKSLNSRGFNIKSAIDFLRFKNGVN